MMKYNVRTLEHAFAYVLDCTLATVASLAMKKTRTQYEYQRQIEIAQTMITWARDFMIGIEATRGGEVVKKFHWSVQAWADQYDVLKGKK